MRKLALTLLLAASLPAFAISQADTQASKKLETDIKACADANCKEKALKDALDSGLPIEVALETALSNNVTVEVALAIAIVASKDSNTSTRKAQAKAIEAVTQAVVKSDGAAIPTSDSIAKVIVAAKNAKIPTSIINSTISNTKINGQAIPIETALTANNTANEIILTQQALANSEAPGAGPENLSLVIPSIAVEPLNACGISPNKPC